MKLAIATTAAALTLGTMAGAATWSFDQADMNHDGRIDMEEAQVIYPEIDAVSFNTYDADTNQYLDEAEYAALSMAMSTNNTSLQKR